MPETSSFRYELIKQSKKSRARVGRIHTPHGIINTPGFVAVGTNASIKALDSSDIIATGQELIFCNTYHLIIQPGTQIIEQAGGLHAFMNYDGPIITDSGGFQVFSLKYGGYTTELKSSGNKTQNNSVLKITEDGVLFRSYRDGSPILLTAETSIAAQKSLGADIIVVFDELLPYHADKKYQLQALGRTHRWELRSLAAHKANIKNQALYAVIHGGIDKEMRRASATFLSQHDFDGFAVGGSVGKNLEEMEDMLSFVMPMLPYEKPNHLLGIADLPSLAKCIPLGIDTFDSSYPTKIARHGLLLTKQGAIKINSAGKGHNFGKIDPTCACFTCQNYSIAYLNHLFKAHELSFYRLASIHNISLMNQLMATYREMILQDQI